MADGAHQDDIGHDGPGEVEDEHSEEDEAECEAAVVAGGDEREVYEGHGGEQREPADERVAARRARAQPRRQRRAQRHAQRAREQPHQPELERHALERSTAVLPPGTCHRHVYRG